MKKVIFVSATMLLVLVVLGGLGAAFVLLGSQDRGTTADGRMAPPASVRNAPEAPKFDASKSKPPATAEKLPEYQLPTELDIATPPVPAGLSDHASGQKS
jgi:hypothetical protein